MLHELYKEGGGTGKRGATTSKDSGVGAQQNNDHSRNLKRAKSGTMFQTMEKEFVTVVTASHSADSSTALRSADSSDDKATRLAAHAQALSEAAHGQKATGNGRTALVLTFVLLVQFLSFAIWHTLARYAIIGLVNDLANQIEHNVVRRSLYITREPILAVGHNAMVAAQGILPFFDITTETSMFFDEHLRDISTIYPKCAMMFGGDDSGRIEGVKQCDFGNWAKPRQSQCWYFGDDTTRDLPICNLRFGVGQPCIDKAGHVPGKTMGVYEAHFAEGTIHRNLSALEWGDPLYDPRKRPWFKPPTSGEPEWSSVYLFSAAVMELGISVSQRTNSMFSTRWGRMIDGNLFASDFSLRDLDTFMRGLKLGPSAVGNPGEAFIVERDGTLVSTTKGSSTHKEPYCLSTSAPRRINPLNPADPVNSQVQRAAQQVVQHLGGFDTNHFAHVGVGDLKGRLVLRAAQINDPEILNLDWLAVVSLNMDEFTQPFKNGANRAILVVVGVCFIAVILIIMVNADCSDRSHDHGQHNSGTMDSHDDLDENELDDMNRVEYDRYKKTGEFPVRVSRYYAFMRKLLQPQINAATHNVDRRAVKTESEDPLPHELALALNIIIDTNAGEDAAFILWKINDSPRWVRVLHNVFYSWTISTLFHLNAWVHFVMVFLEAPMGDGFVRGEGEDLFLIQFLGGTVFLLYFIECAVGIVLARQTAHAAVARSKAIILVCVITMFIEWLIMITDPDGSMVEVASRQQMRQACQATFVGSNHTSQWSPRVDECVMFCAAQLPRPVGNTSALVHCASNVLGHVKAGTHLKYLQPPEAIKQLLPNNILLILPVTALLRPLCIGFRFQGIRKSASHILFTLKAALPILVLFGFLLLIGTTQGMLLFYNRGIKMDNLLDAFTVVFTFMVSGENYGDFAWTPTDCNIPSIRKVASPEKPNSYNTFLGGPQSGACSEFGFNIYTTFYSFLGLVRMLRSQKNVVLWRGGGC